jgi:dolichol-phosphate mannosyltransferase
LQLTAIIPTFNEAQNLPGLVSALFELPIENLRILIVDDNSPDGTGEVAERLAGAHPGRLGVLHRPAKLGLGRAYLSGFQRALQDGAQAIAQMDADFSHPPEKLPPMLQALEGCDIVLGSRYVPGGSVDLRWPLWRKSLSAFGNFYARMILNLPIRDATGGFRIWRREALERMPLERIRSNGYAFQVETAYVASRLGFSLVEIPIYFADRRWGQSKMSLRIQREAALQVWQMKFRYRTLHPKDDLPQHRYNLI